MFGNFNSSKYLPYFMYLFTHILLLTPHLRIWFYHLYLAKDNNISYIAVVTHTAVP
jgi:hypothetical protein